MRQEGVKSFLKRRFVWVIVPAIALPLLTLLIVQYRSLRTLEQTLPLYRREALSQYVKAVTEEVYELYYTNAERTLAVPAAAIDSREGGIIQDNAERTRALAAVERAADHFRRQQFRGAKRFFVAVETEYAGDYRSEVLFYNPARQSMERNPQAPEMRAINVAFAPYRFYIRSKTLIQPESTGVPRDSNYLLIVKPILEQGEHIAGLAGMVLDQEWFRQEVVPEAARKALPRFFPSEYQNAVVTLRFNEDQPVFLTRAAGDPRPEFYLRFSLGLGRYTFGIRMRDLSVEQWARRSFTINLSLSAAMTLLLVGSLLLGWRAAARELRLLQMKTDFVSNVSHEFRTPLASIRVLAELLKFGRVQDQAKVREFGSYIDSQGRRLTQLVSNILDFARIESGQKEYRFARADVREVVDEALEACAGRVEQSGHLFRLVPPEQPLPPVALDPDALALALTNLLDNAIKYSEKGQEILLRLGQEEDAVTVSVTDHGIGIPREEHEKIFEKFYRVSTGMVHDVKGSGLGLSIVKHIVEAHHGRITVESEPGRGSTFTIRLPLGEGFGPPTAAGKNGLAPRHGHRMERRADGLSD